MCVSGRPHIATHEPNTKNISVHQYQIKRKYARKVKGGGKKY